MVMNEVERWRQIADIPTHEVSDLGRVRSVPRKGTGGRILVPFHMPRDGRVECYRVNLPVVRRSYTRSVHRLVLDAFVGPRPDGLVGCHGDGNPANNALRNLRWDTQKANVADALDHGTVARRERHGFSKLTEDAVRCIRAEPAFHGVNAMLGRCFGISHGHVRRIRLRESWA